MGGKTVTDADGQFAQKDHVQWEDLEQRANSSWIYKLPASDTQPCKCVIACTAEADRTGRITDATVSDHGETDCDDGPRHVDAGEDKGSIKKSYDHHNGYI